MNREVPQLEQRIRQIDIDIKGIDRDVNALSSTQPKAQKLRNLILATDSIIALYDEAINSSQKGVDLILLQKMQTLFNQVAFNGLYR
ncbi:hypothetical protein [Vibrio vulnificus]|uniref:hypothetical protein n=1 Tax=Vibrio vulnificus TaxID=672 RepID=UPI001CF2E120|nr:hypothetical protein [Vibrio vulnificus]